MTFDGSAERTVLVTGGSRGIGAAIAERLARDGWSVALNYAASAAAADAVADRIREAGGRVRTIRADVSDAADVRGLFAEIDREMPRLEGLVNNAGIASPLGNFTDIDDAAMVRVVSINVTGAMLVAREAARRMMRSRGGAGGIIVNLGSPAFRLGNPGELVAYATTKGAIASLTIGLARELGAEGVRVNTLAPGLIPTDMAEGRDIGKLLAGVPMGRLGTVEEVAEAASWLMSEKAGYVSGTTLDVTGGR